MAKSREVRTVQNPAMLAAGMRPDVLVWRQQSGLFRSYDDPDRLVRVGQVGMADLGMIVAVTITPDMVGKTIGVAVQPECKTRTGKHEQDQKAWAASVQARGGVYRLVKSAGDMLALIEDVKSGRAF